MLHNRALCMKKTNPKVKLLAMLCDPVKRFISHAKHTRSWNQTATERDLATVKYVRSGVKQLILNQHKSYLVKKEIEPNSTHLLRPNATDFAYGPFKKALVTVLAKFQTLKDNECQPERTVARCLYDSCAMAIITNNCCLLSKFSASKML